MDLATPLDIICRIIVRSREVEAQVPGIDPDNDDPVDDSDDERDVLEDELDETAVDELRTAIDDLAEDQQIELLALALVGQGTYDASEWEDALEEAGDDGAEPAIEAAALPRRRGADVRAALTEGEDYELVFAVASRSDRAQLERAWSRAFPRLRLTCIGRFVRAGARSVGAADLSALHGYEHLR